MRGREQLRIKRKICSHESSLNLMHVLTINYQFSAKPTAVEKVTESFQQPDDEVPRQPEPEPGTLVAAYSCLHEGNWYREREEFSTGPNNCAICLCVNGQIKCNNESCPRIPKTTTTTTTTTQAPTTTEIVGVGERGIPGKNIAYSALIL